MDTIYDVMILGAGPAGLTAALYAGRSGLNTLLLEQGQDGGQIALTDEIENYPGQLEGESGAALIARMSAQAERFGAVRARDVIRSAELTGTVKTLTGLQNAYPPGPHPGPSAAKMRSSTLDGAFPTAPPVTPDFSGTRPFMWPAAAASPWRRRCISPALPGR